MTAPAHAQRKFARLGKLCDVLVAGAGTENRFGNPQVTADDYVVDRQVYAARTYDNRNTEVQNRRGDRHRDRPVFLVANGDGTSIPEPPGQEDRLTYDGTTYEVKALTVYESHVEFFGRSVEEVTNG